MVAAQHPEPERPSSTAQDREKVAMLQQAAPILNTSRSVFAVLNVDARAYRQRLSSSFCLAAVLAERHSIHSMTVQMTQTR